MTLAEVEGVGQPMRATAGVGRWTVARQASAQRQVAGSRGVLTRGAWGTRRALGVDEADSEVLRAGGEKRSKAVMSSLAFLALGSAISRIACNTSL